jgi:hypothetical protein
MFKTAFRGSTRIGTRVRLVASLLTLLLVATQASAQLLKKGEAVLTTFSGFAVDSTNHITTSPPTIDPNRYVLRIVDIRDKTGVPTGQNWQPSVYENPSWTAANMGQVFGITIDSAGAIYTTATTVYGDYRTGCTGSQPMGAFGSGGAGAVYRTDPISGAVSVFTSLPNTAVGLGNIAYDPTYNQLFVTNFGDGQIYRIPILGASAGTIQAWAPFGINTALPDGFAPLGKRPWGIGVSGNQVYFSNWTEDYNRTGAANSIYWVALTAGALPSTPVAATDKFDLTTSSDPVSDIEFSSDGLRMLLAERTMAGDIRCPVVPGSAVWAHQSSVFEYTRPTVSGNLWTQNTRFDIGFYPGSGVRNNSAGGADYGYGGFNQALSAPEQCEQMIWATGDYLLAEATGPSPIYGLEGIVLPNTGLPLGANYYYDIDFPFKYANSPTDEKAMPGDVVVWRDPCSTGYIEVCKASCPTNQIPPNGIYNFTVPGSAFSTKPLMVPVGECSGPIPVTTGMPTIAELPTPGVSVCNVTAVGYRQFAGLTDLLVPGSFNPTAGTAEVIVQPPATAGNTSLETIVTFYNYVAPPALLKLCKIAGEGVAAGTSFPFTAVNITNAGSGYRSAPSVTFTGGGCTTEPTATASISSGFVTGITMTSPGSGCTMAPVVTVGAPPIAQGNIPATATAAIVSVEAGPTTEGGYCVVVPGTFEVGTSGTVTEMVPAGDTAPAITVNGVSTPSTGCTPSTSAAYPCSVMAMIGPGINEVSFTNSCFIKGPLGSLPCPVPLPFPGGGAENLRIVNYSLVSQVATGTQSYVTYRADLLNTGTAVGPMIARLTSLDTSSVQVMGQGELSFEPAPANSQVTSSNTFTILTDPTVPLDFSKLNWTFHSRRSMPPRR